MSRPIGVNTWVWASPLDDEALARLAVRVRDWGFDAIELPVESPGDWDPERTADLLRELGLDATVVLVMGPGRELVDAPRAVIAETQDYLRRVVDAAAAVGSPVIAGPAYASVGRTWRVADRPGVYRELRANLAPVGDYAAERGITIAVEPLNRYETSLINTVDQALDALEGLAGCSLALDVYHMNIEETDIPAAIVRAGDRIGHVQVSANDRGAPGRDHLDWRAILHALDLAGYPGPLVIESFTAHNATIATAASIWRPLAPTQDAIAVDGLTFLRSLLVVLGLSASLSISFVVPGTRAAIERNIDHAYPNRNFVQAVGRVEVHYQIDAADLKTSSRPPGEGKLGVDKGYTEVVTDSDGVRHGKRLGALLSAESDHLKVKNSRRAKLHAAAAKAREEGRFAKAERIERCNLGTVKRDRRHRRFEQQVRTETFTAVHAVVDKASRIVAEDLTRAFVSRKSLGKNTNRRLAAWTKGVTAEALINVSERRGSALTLVNAAHTSQVAPCCGVFGRRAGDRLDCTRCGAVWQADLAGAINVLERDGDTDISLWTPHTRVKQVLQERGRRRTRLPVQGPSTRVRGANHPKQAATPKT